MGTNFFTNEKENTLLEKIEGVFKYKKVHFFDALVGYFRASGYFRIRKFITQTPKLVVQSQRKANTGRILQRNKKQYPRSKIR